MRKIIITFMLILPLCLSSCFDNSISPVDDESAPSNISSRATSNVQCWNTQASMIGNSSQYKVLYKLADFTRDSVKDLIQINLTTGRAYIWPSTRSSFGNYKLMTDWYGPMKDGNYTYDVADVNYDGRADVIQINHDDGNAYVFFCTGDFFQSKRKWANYRDMNNNGNKTYKVADVNGDYRADIVQIDHDNGYANVWLSNNTYFKSKSNWSSQGTMIDNGDMEYGIADVNGDNKFDIVQINLNYQKAFVWTSNGSSFNNYQIWGAVSIDPNIHSIHFADVNRDKRTDIITINHTTGNANVNLASYNVSWGLNPYRTFSSYGNMTGGNKTYLVGDVNWHPDIHDYKSDIVQINHNDKNAYVWLTE